MFLLQTLMAIVMAAFVVLVAADPPPCDDGSVPTNTFTLSLCEEFQAIRDLAPYDQVIAIIQNHMQNDIRFRKAVQYMMMPQFSTTTRQIDSSAIYQQILQRFLRAGVNTTDIDRVEKIFDCVILPAIRDATESIYSGSVASGSVASGSVASHVMAKSRSLDTALVEVNQLIPYESLVRLLQRHLSENPQYLAFYKIVREPSFQAEVLQGFRSREIARSIKTLRRHQIDLCQMVQYAFNVYAQGPVVE